MSNTTFTDNLVSFDGDGADMNITGATATTLNTQGGNINVTGGTGNGTGDGGDIIISAGVDGGSGTQGTITFSALDNTAPLPFNETGDTDLVPSFTAASIVGALNELKGNVTAPAEQNVYTSITNLNYNGSTPVDVPGSISITTGTWLINYSVTFTTSDPTVPVAIYIRDSGNTILDDSKTFINDNGSSQRHTVTKQFLYTEAGASNELKISFQLDTGVAMTVAVEMDAVSGTGNPDQVPLIWAARVEGTFDQNVYTTVSDLDYAGTSEVDVPGTITLTAGDWLIGYSLTLRTPSAPDDILVFVQDAGNTPITVSKTFLTKNITTIRHSVSKAFVFTASATSYRLTFRLNTTATISPAVEMSALSGVADPDQVPVLWAIDLSSLTSAQNVYTTVTDLNYSGTSEVDIPGTMTLTSGSWILGYSLALNAPNVSDSMLVHVRDSSDNIVGVSKTFVTEVSTSSRHTISRSFFLTQILTSEDYKISFRLNSSGDTSVAVEMSGFAGADPDQVPVLWGVRLGEVTSGGTFLSLTDTPNSYVGQANKLVYVDGAETGLQFSLLTAGTNDDLSLTLPSDLELGVPDLTQLNTRLASGGHILVQSGTFTLTSTLMIPDDCVIEGSGNEQTVFTRSGVLSMFSLGNNVTFKNCKFDGNNQSGNVITFNNVTNSVLEDCVFEDCLVDDNLVISGGSTFITVKSCTFIGSTGTCIQTEDPGTNEINIVDCKFDNIDNSTEVIRIDDSKNVLISNCIFNSGDDIVLAGTYIDFSSNFLDTMTSGLTITGDFIIVSNCLIDSSGISLNSSPSNVNILSNVVTNSTGNGILVSNGSAISIISNNIRSNSVDGINVGSSVNDIRIVGNHIESNTVFGIEIAGANTQFVICDNIIKNNTDSGINSIGTGTISGNNIENNGNFNIEIGNNSGKVIIENNKMLDSSFLQPSLNFSIGTGNDDDVCVRSNMAVSFTNANDTLNPYDDNVVCNAGTLTLGDLVPASAGHRIFFNATSGSVTINPTSFQGFSNIVLVSANDNATFEWTGYNWTLVGKTLSITATGVRPHYLGTGNTQSIPTNTNTPLIFSTITSNSGITQNGSGVFSFDQTGFYQIDFTSNGGSFNSGDIIRGFINHSANAVSWGFNDITIVASITNIAITASAMIKLNSASETVTCEVFHNFGSNVGFVPASVTITWIGPI